MNGAAINSSWGSVWNDALDWSRIVQQRSQKPNADATKSTLSPRVLLHRHKGLIMAARRCSSQEHCRRQLLQQLRLAEWSWGSAAVANTGFPDKGTSALLPKPKHKSASTNQATAPALPGRTSNSTLAYGNGSEYTNTEYEGTV